MGLTVEDQLAIQALAARYNFAIDTGDGEAFAATFVEKGVLPWLPSRSASPVRCGDPGTSSPTW
jgi:hypothetical protein